MRCSECKRIWHVGDDQCPTCSAFSEEYLREQAAAATSDAGGPASNGETETGRGFSRREFLIGALAGSTAASVAILVPVALTEWIDDKDGNGAPTDTGGSPAVVVATFRRTKIASLSDLSPGEPFDFEYPLEGQRNFVVKLGAPAHGGIGGEGDIVAFSYACTHMGCPLIGMYKDEHKILGPCGCHYTTFDLTRGGMVVLGQATENLPQITLALDGDDVYATGVMGLIFGYRDNLADGTPAEVTA